MTGFGDQAFAQSFRNTVTRIVRKVVSEERPEPRIGKVFSYDANNQVAQVLFAGEKIDSLVKVRVAKNMEPQVTMDVSFDALAYEAPADIVRVWGKPGSYFLLDYYSGAPNAGMIIGVPMPWLTATPPTKCVILDGATYSRYEYPALFALWGTFFNTGGEAATDFRVPDGRGRMLIGADGTITLGSKGGDKTKVITAANLPPHAHTISHTHGIARQTNAYTGGTGGTNLALGQNADFSNGGTMAASTSSSGNGPGTSAPMDVLNPYLGVNWIVRAAA